ncbi:uncharacterized protein ACRADG_010671 isoform 1-T1 [Cochliomyia hominivorax]
MNSKICCFQIRTVVIFTGFFYLIHSILWSSTLILNLIKYNEDKSKAAGHHVPFDEDREVVSALSVSISLSLTFVLTSPFLLWGAFKENHKFLIPWLYNSFCCILVNSIYLFVKLLKNIYEIHKENNEFRKNMFMLLFMAFGLAIQIIFYKIVYKYYRELIVERELEYLENSSTIFIVYDQLPDQS